MSCKNNNLVGARINQALGLRDKTQMWLANEIGRTQANISHYIKGTCRPNCATLTSIARALNVSTDYLCGLTSEAEPDKDMGLVLNCALRYALGRRTYVTSTISRYIRDHIKELDQKTIGVMISDIERCASKGSEALGQDCDRQSWLALLGALKTAYAKDK